MKADEHEQVPRNTRRMAKGVITIQANQEWLKPGDKCSHRKNTTTNRKDIEGPCVEDRFDLFCNAVLDMPLWPHKLEI